MVPLLHAPAGRAPRQYRIRPSRRARRALTFRNPSYGGSPLPKVCSQAPTHRVSAVSAATQVHPSISGMNSHKAFIRLRLQLVRGTVARELISLCLLYTSDAADE